MLLNIIPPLSGFEMLAGIISPAVLVSASASLILSTANRLGRIYDRVNLLKAEVEKNLTSKDDFQKERLEYFDRQLTIQKKRANLIQKAMTSLYLATLLFISSSIALGIILALGSQKTFIATAIIFAGGAFLFIALAALLYESRHNLIFIRGQIEFTEFLRSQISLKKD